jgi:acyl carrier protein
MTDQKKHNLDSDKTPKDIKKLVKDVIAQQLGVDESKIVESASFANDLGADSLDVVELVMALEEKFDITIPDEHSEKIQTFGAAVEYIREHLEGRDTLEGSAPAA